MSIRVLQRLLAGVICCFVLAVFYISFVIMERQAALQKVSRYDAAWTVTQALTELLRLENALVRYPNRGADFDEVNLRLDIMFSRLSTFEQGSAGEVGEGRSLRRFVRDEPVNEAAIALLRRRLNLLDANIQEQRQNFDVDHALQLIEPLDVEMTALAARAAAFGAQRVVDDKSNLSRLHLIFTSLALGLIICGIILIILLVVQKRALSKAHRHLEATASALETTHKALGLQNQRFDAALNSMSQALCTCNASGQLILFNERFRELAGQLPIMSEAVLQDTLLSSPEDAFGMIYRQQMPLIREHRRGAFTVDLPDGRSFSIFHEPLADGGWLATYADVSERRRAEAEIMHMAHHDGLTGLPNRVFLLNKLEQLFGAPDTRENHISILLLDLDSFKEVNDTLGHYAGDEVLKSVATRLLDCVAEKVDVTRLGGDEFAILLPGSDGSPDEVINLAYQILATLKDPFTIEGREFVLGASIGIATERLSRSTAPDLLKRADLAMYKAKASGKGQVVTFDPGIETQLTEKKSLEQDLREAVSRDEMMVFYQPLLDAQTCQVVGYEALLRWKRGHCDFVSPADFIPVAEETGLINSLGDWVLRTACKDAMAWSPDINVSVNLSPVQFRIGNVVHNTVRVLSETGLSPHRLEYEITESVLLDATDATLETLHQLKSLGVRIALDDFGTGYSSLSYLSQFPFDKIKIDRSFIGDLVTSGSDAAVVDLVINLGKKLGIAITAEGVETEAQFTRLRAMGCTQVQGFLFSKPKSISELLGADGAGIRRLQVK